MLANLESAQVLAHVFKQKEIENYLLNPAVIDRVVASLTRPTSAAVLKEDVKSEETIRTIIEPMKSDIQAQLLARRHEFLKASGIDASVAHKESLKQFDASWASIEGMIAISSGKEVLHQLRTKIQETWNVTLTDARIIEGFWKEDVSDEMSALLNRLEAYRQANKA